MKPPASRHPASEIKLIPLTAFRKAAKTVLGTSKAESDRQLAAFQNANAARRDDHGKPRKSA